MPIRLASNARKLQQIPIAAALQLLSLILFAAYEEFPKTFLDIQIV